MTPPGTSSLDSGTAMPLVRHFKRMVIDVMDDGTHLLHLGEIEIWDGADLALLREGLAQLIEKDRCRSIAVDMRYVKYIPSGFFGMLFDWYERRGVGFALTPPQPNVQRMLWFRQFFRLNDDGWYELHPDPVQPMLAGVGMNIEALEVEDDEDM